MAGVDTVQHKPSLKVPAVINQVCICLISSTVLIDQMSAGEEVLISLQILLLLDLIQTSAAAGSLVAATSLIAQGCELKSKH